MNNTNDNIDNLCNNIYDDLYDDINNDVDDDSNDDESTDYESTDYESTDESNDEQGLEYYNNIQYEENMTNIKHVENNQEYHYCALNYMKPLNIYPNLKQKH